MVTVRRGRLANPVTLVKESPSPVLRGALASSERFQTVYVKLTSRPQCFIELICSWIGLYVGLPIPQPCIVEVHRSKLPAGAAWPLGSSSSGTFFGSIEVEGAQQLHRMPSTVERGLAGWSHLEMAAAFDHLIANDDRTAGNLLLAPDQSLFLIDHARSLGGAGSRLFSTDVTPLFTNYFLRFIAARPLAEREASKYSLIRACIALQNAVLQIPFNQLGVPEEMAEQIRDFLSKRAAMIQSDLLSQIGLPELPSFSEASQPRLQ